MAEIDMVNHPPHYTAGKYETIDIIEDTTWGYRLATAFKYLHRCEYKGKKKEDLRKAVWFLLREIDSIPDDEPFNPIKDLAEDLYDGCYDDFLCKGCNKPTAIVDSNWLCGNCHIEKPTKTNVGYEDNPYLGQFDSKGSESHSNGLSPNGKVIPHNLPKDVLEAHTERQNAELDRREEYRANYRRSFGTHKPNSDQLVMKELSQYEKN